MKCCNLDVYILMDKEDKIKLAVDNQPFRSLCIDINI